jgi:predicted membrane-bound dolichyl-phosphate-mannose-protein mannosyltransferase
MIMTKFATFAAALSLSATSALAGGFVAPVVEVEPVVVEQRAATTNAGLVVPALLLLAVIAAVASDNDDS